MDNMFAVEEVMKTLVLCPNVRKATLYISEKLVVSMCWRFKPDKRSRTQEFVLKVGAPNYAERAFVARCKKARNPVRADQVHLKLWPKKRAAKK